MRQKDYCLKSKDMKFRSFLFLAMAFFVFFSCKGKKSEGTVTVACNIPITGDFALYGESVQKGIMMAQKEYQDSLKKWGISVDYDFQDNRSNSKDAVTVFKKQALHGYDIYMSGITQQTASIMPSQSKSGKPHFIWSYVPLVLSREDNVFRTWVDYPQEADYFLTYLANHPQFKRIACIYPNAESAQALYNELFIPRLPEGVSVVFNEAFDVAKSNFKDIVLKIKSRSPDILFINGWDNHLPNLIKEVTINGLRKEGNLVFTFDLMDAVPKISSELMEGLIANIPDFVVSPSDGFIAWQSRFAQEYGTSANYTNAYAYDLANIIVSAARKVKENPGLSLTDALLATDMNGITGHLLFSPEGMLVGHYITSVYHDSHFIPLAQ